MNCLGWYLACTVGTVLVTSLRKATLTVNLINLNPLNSEEKWLCIQFGHRLWMNFVIIVAEGLDLSNPGEETICDVKVRAEVTTLQAVHESIAKVLCLCESEELFYCFTRNTDVQLSLCSTFDELGIISGDSIILDARNNKKRKTVSCLKPSKEDVLGKESAILELICTTRLLEVDGNAYRKVRVVVQSHQKASYLMHDISNLWGRNGLKFKCGRNVLSAERTYAELGIENEAEVVITGGRG